MFYEATFAGAASSSTRAAEQSTLADLLARVQQARELASRQGANQLADDLDSVGLKLSQAMRAGSGRHSLAAPETRAGTAGA